MSGIWHIILSAFGGSLRDLQTTDVSRVRYDNGPTASVLAIGLAGAVAVTALRLWLRRRPSRHHSGHHVAARFRKSIVARALHHAPKLLLAGAVTLLLVAFADPYLTATQSVSGSAESRIRVDLVDVSGSMAWEFSGTGKSKAEIARDAHLRFIEMRRGKGDRVSLWLFSSYPYMVDDFLADDELYYFELADAPLVMAEHLDRSMVVPRDRVQLIKAEGNSDIVKPLRAIIRQLDRDMTSSHQPAGVHRAVLILTDAAVDEFPEAELAALHRRQVVPYIIFINPESEVIHGGAAAVPRLIERIRDYGGDYFSERDPEGLVKAYKAIDAREAVRYETKHRAVRVPIYQRFLLPGLGLFIIAILMGFPSEVLWGTYP